MNSESPVKIASAFQRLAEQNREKKTAFLCMHLVKHYFSNLNYKHTLQYYLFAWIVP